MYHFENLGRKNLGQHEQLRLNLNLGNLLDSLREYLVAKIYKGKQELRYIVT